MMPIAYKAGYKYQLTNSVIIETNIIPPEEEVAADYIFLSRVGYLRILKGYAWDGISGPTWDTKNTRRASLVHDALYQLIRMELLPAKARKAADKLYRTMCIEDGMWRVRAWWQYRALRVGGGPSASSDNVKKILRAP